MPTDAEQELVRAARLRDRRSKGLQDANEVLAETIRAAATAGMTRRRIAQIVGLSHQRVHQIIGNGSV